MQLAVIRKASLGGETASSGNTLRTSLRLACCKDPAGNDEKWANCWPDGAYQPYIKGMPSHPLHQLSREPIPGELVPAHYFRPLSSHEMGRPGHPLEIDLGCGDGSFLMSMAKQYPTHDFIGVERLLGRVRKVCRKAQRQGLHNIKVLRLDSKYLVEWLLPPKSVSRLHLLCPDPWPKAKHHRRRLIQVEFLKAIKRCLTDDGEFLFMTDHPEYHEWTHEVLDEFGGFDLLDWNEDSFFYPKTDFQLQWEAEGKSMMRTRCVKPTT